MGIALVAASKKTSSILSSATPRTQQFTTTTTVGNKLICCVGFGGNPTSASVSVSDAFHGAWTQIGTLVANGTTAYVAIFMVDSTHALTSSDNVTIAYTGTVVNWVGLSEWSGVATGGAANTVSNTGSTSSASTSALSAATAGDLVIGVFGLASASTFAVGTDGQGNTMTSLHAPTAGGGRQFGVEYLIESGTSAYNPAATWGANAAWAAQGVRFNAGSTTQTATLTATQAETATQKKTVAKVFTP